MRIISLYQDFKKIFFKQKKNDFDYNYVLRTKKFSKSKRQKIEHRFINNILRKNKIKEVLDYGCNDGRLAISIGKEIKYEGVDINKNIKKIHLYSKNIKIYNKNIYLKKKFECIILSHVIGHVSNPLNLIKSLKKNIKRNGIIIIITPNKYFKFYVSFKNLFNNYFPDNTVLKYYSKTEILSILNILNLKLFYFKKYSIQNNSISKDLVGERLIFIAKK
jgi:2-polyprenyl-3-methyl-5-hydroxy-6-metoxy-1,4-benzoquinol methylase